MKRSDPLQAPEAEEWLWLDESERIRLAAEYHRRARIRLPNVKVHAVFHVIAENQIALGDKIPVRRTLVRLMEEGLDRPRRSTRSAWRYQSISTILSKEPSRNPIRTNLITRLWIASPPRSGAVRGKPPRLKPSRLVDEVAQRLPGEETVAVVEDDLVAPFVEIGAVARRVRGDQHPRQCP
jgi:hypothetical protein